MKTQGLVLLVALLGTLPVVAQTSRQNVSDQLKVVTDLKADDGFTPDTAALGRSTVLGVLEHESTVYLETTLDPGREYHIAGRCDTGCTNVDLRLLNPDFSPLTEDLQGDDQPRLDVRPTEAGAHLLAIRMTSCEAQICYFGVVIVSRPVRR